MGSAAIQATTWVWSGDQVALMYFDDDIGDSVDPVLTHRYLYAPGGVDQVLADEKADQEVPTNVRWLLADHEGTVRDVLDSAGAVVNQRVYDSFGRLVSESQPSETTAYGYAGREYDALTGLSYNRARYYDPGMGRFLSEDPIGMAGDSGGNLYRYVGNQPVTRTDPSGLMAFGGLMGGGIGAGASLSLNGAGAWSNVESGGGPPASRSWLGQLNDAYWGVYKRAGESLAPMATQYAGGWEAMAQVRSFGEGVAGLTGAAVGTAKGLYAFVAPALNPSEGVIQGMRLADTAYYVVTGAHSQNLQDLGQAADWWQEASVGGLQRQGLGWLSGQARDLVAPDAARQFHYGAAEGSAEVAAPFVAGLLLGELTAPRAPVGSMRPVGAATRAAEAAGVRPAFDFSEIAGPSLDSQWLNLRTATPSPQWVEWAGPGSVPKGGYYASPRLPGGPIQLRGGEFSINDCVGIRKGSTA